MSLGVLERDLQTLLGDRLSVADAVRDHHSRGEGHHDSHPPDAVVFPQSTEEVAAVVAACARHGVPIVPFGAGSSLEGHVAALRGGVSIDLSQMNRVLRVGPEDLDATVEAGVTRLQLNEALKGTGLAFFIDPGADATIGGMTATGASGTTAVRYGTMRENVLGLTVVLADGRVMRTGGRARKSSAGYDLTRLFVGSEGTLGVITEVTLRLHPVPAAISAAICPFDDLAGAVNTVIETIQLGIPVARVELLDEVFMEAVRRFSSLPYPAQPTLFFEFHGPSDASVSEQAESVREIAAEHGGHSFHWASDAGERSRLWKARHDAYFAALALKPGHQAWVTDVCVPISRLTESILAVKQDAATSALTCAVLGHVGDGNFHAGYLFDPAHPEQLAEAKRLNDLMVGRALAAGGTCTGEHGIGLGKMGSLAKEHGDSLEAMRAIKRALDPANLMNPGKIFSL